MNTIKRKNNANSHYEVVLMGVNREHRYFYFDKYISATNFVHRVCKEYRQYLAFKYLIGTHIISLSNGCPIMVKLLNIDNLSDVCPNYEFGAIPSMVGFVGYDQAAEAINKLAQESARTYGIAIASTEL